MAVMLFAFAACMPREVKKSRTVLYMNGSNIFASEEVKEGETIDLVSKTFSNGFPVKAEDETFTYTFSGWAESENGERLSSVLADRDLTLYALFSAAEKEFKEEGHLTVVFMGRDDSGEQLISTQKIAPGEKPKVPVEIPTPTGYRFTGWDRDPAEQISARTQFNAQYEKCSYKLFTHVLGEVNEEELAFESPLTFVDPPKKEGLIFEGWFCERDFQTPESHQKMPASDLHIYAKYGVDFGSAHMTFPANMIYGSENTVRIEGLNEAENISYSFLWQDGSNGRSLPLLKAGEQTLSVKITASVDAGEGSFTDETTVEQVLTVAKKPLKITLSAQDITYGEAPAVVPTYEGLAFEQDSVPLTLIFFDESETEQTAFPAGRYRVEGRVADAENYEVTDIFPAEFTVHPRTLTVRIDVQNCVYGSAPQMAPRFEGFVDGEDESAVSTSENFVNLSKDGEIVSSERLCAGDYTASPRLEAFSARNYVFQAGEPAPFTVSKATFTVELVLEKTELVYGEEPNFTLQKGSLAYPDESEEELFGAPLSVKYEGAEQFHAGEYTAHLDVKQENANYEIVSVPVPFTIAKREVSITLPETNVLFGEQTSLPQPVIEGVIEGEESVKEQISAAIVMEIASGEQIFPQDSLLRAGEYVLKIRFEGELGDYSVVCTDGSYRVEKRSFAIRSGEVSRNRNLPWSYTPAFSGGEETLFRAEGELVLDTKDAGVYLALREEELARNHYLWQTPLKFFLISDGTDVTDCFAVSYELNITLNNSHFSITLPFTQKNFVYDGKEYTYPIEVATEAGDSEGYSVHYTVNGSPADVPKVKNAGEYEITCEISAANYETEQRTYRVTVEKANYVFAGEWTDVETSFNGKAAATLPSLGGVGGESVSENLTVSIEYTPVIGEKATYPHWVDPVNAGEYQITLTASGNPNYNDETRSAHIKINRSSYSVDAPDQEYTYEPNTPFGKGITVTTAGEPATVEYDFGGAKSGEAPVFREAVPDGAVIGYRVLESNNYEERSGQYRITVKKKRGELDVSSVNKFYVYTGEMQTVSGGATSNNHEDEQIVYENNTFTSVKEGNSLVVTVRLLEGKNYTGATEVLSNFRVEKKSFSSLPCDSPLVSEQYNAKNKTLKDVFLPKGFSWKNGDDTLSLGVHDYEAIYNPDSENHNDFALRISFSTRKEHVTVRFSGGEADIGTEEFSLADYSLTGEDGKVFEREESLLSFQAEGTPDKQKGGTYPITCTLSESANDYFELVGEKTAIVPFKLKSVLYEGTLYTLEDALHNATAGLVTLKKDTCVMEKSEKEKLSMNPYPDESYYTVKKGVKLLVPYKEDDGGSTAQNAKQDQAAVAGDGFCRLHVTKGNELKVEGELIVNALRSSSGQRTSMVVGTNFATLELDEGSSVRVLSGGSLESMGFTFGKGEVFAEKGGKIYEPFAMVGWKGGAISAAIRYKVFPINQYALSSLEAKTHFAAGAEYVLRASLTATISIGSEQSLDLQVIFLGNESAFLELKTGEIVKELDENKKTLFTVKGEMTFHNLTLQLNNTIKFDTSGIQVPIPGNIAITLAEGSTASIPQNVALKLLPGAETVIEQNATLNIEEGGALLSYGKSNVTFDGVDAWKDGGNGMAYPNSSISQAYRGGATFHYDNKTPAVVKVLGILDAKTGSTLAAEITTDGEGKVTSDGAMLDMTIEEDNTPAINNALDKLKALSGNGGSFFKATLKAYLNGEEM